MARAPSGRDVPITKAHWKPDTGVTHCAEPGCGVVFDLVSRKHHCRRCGNVFCARHVGQQRRLAPNGTPDAVHGVWCKVCPRCFEGEPQTIGALRDQTEVFLQCRAVSRRRQRGRTNDVLDTMSRLLSVPGSLFGTISPQEAQTLGLPWMDNASTFGCLTCRTLFSWMTRRHHCRLCGGVFCATCTRTRVEVSAQDLHFLWGREEPFPGKEDTRYVRVCTTCIDFLDRRRRALVHGRRIKAVQEMPLHRLYEQLRSIRESIDRHIHKLSAIAEGRGDAEDSRFALGMVDDLTELWIRFERLMKTLPSLPCETEGMQNILKSVKRTMVNYLQQNTVHIRTYQKAAKDGTLLPTPPSTSKFVSAAMFPARKASSSSSSSGLIGSSTSSETRMTSTKKVEAEAEETKEGEEISEKSGRSELLAVQNAYLLLRRLSQENNGFSVFRIRLAPHYRESVEKIREELSGIVGTELRGENWETYERQLDHKVKCWGDIYKKPLLALPSDDQFAQKMLQRNVQLVQRSLDQLEQKASPGHCPVTRRTLLQLREVVTKYLRQYYSDRV